MKVCNFSSGSKGNCTYIESKNTKILVDIGVSTQYVVDCLHAINVNANEIDAIIITHEHSDHIKGLKTFVNKYNTKVFCDEKIYLQLIHNFTHKENLLAYNSDFFINDLHIYPISLPHDAVHCNGYMIIEGNAVLSIITDLGFMPENVLNIIKSSSLIYLESNYDEEMLFSCSQYPTWLKNRISSNRGHLSNKDCAKVIEILAQNKVKNIVLSHISENSNTEELAYYTIKNYLYSKQIFIGTDINIDIAHQNRPSTIFNIKAD